MGKGATAEAERAEVRVVGKVVMRKLDDVKPNPWNPNVMTPFEMESLKHGLVHDGWLSSQSLLIWGSDPKGKAKNLIIDGEHRWTSAKELGLKVGPMVFLENLPEAKAKALTVKMNQKRGKADPEDLSVLLKSIQFELGVENMALDLGIVDEQLMKLLAETGLPGDDPITKGVNGLPGEMPSGQASHVRMVQLFFNKEQFDEFQRLVKECAAGYGTKDTTATVLEALRRDRSAQKSRS